MNAPFPIDAAVPAATPMAMLPLQMVADVQDSLMSADHDLDRLQRLLNDASTDLIGHFHAANALVADLARRAAHEPALDVPGLHDTLQHLAGAITALQFQDLASQLIAHTALRLKHCADRLGQDSLDGDGEAFVTAAPTRPNPVTQDEMDAGSVDLF